LVRIQAGAQFMKRLTDLSEYSPEKLHSFGSKLRERDIHLEALLYLNYAIIGYQKKGNYRGVVEALKDKMLTWKHLFLMTGDLIYAALSKKGAEAMLEIAKEKNLKDKFSTSYFRLGEAAVLYKNYEEASHNYKKALKYYKGPLSEKGDYRYHLGEVLYRLGKKKQGLNTILRGLAEIDRGAKEFPSFVINVWKSGCHLRLFELLMENERVEALLHLKEAERIINSDKNLVIRRRQLEDFKKSLSL
jgi:tetratricopeptide (TPR) repeat protein